MKTLNLLLGILIGLSIASCSSDTGENETNPNPEKTMLVYKKASVYENSVLTSSQEVIYNSDKKVENVVTKIDFIYSNYDVGKVIPFHREHSLDYFIVFDLKPSEKLPLTEIHEYTDYSIESSELVYDSHNIIIREGNGVNYTEFDYVEI